MADCYYHGYSGGPGGDCSICEEEKESGKPEGSSGKHHDSEVTTHDWRNGRYGRMGQPGNPNPPTEAEVTVPVQ